MTIPTPTEKSLSEQTQATQDLTGKIAALIFPTGTLPYKTVLHTLSRGPRRCKVSRTELLAACEELRRAGKLRYTGPEKDMLTLPERRQEVLQGPQQRVLEVLATRPSVPFVTLKKALIRNGRQGHLTRADFWDACNGLIDDGRAGVIGCRGLNGGAIGEMHLSEHRADAVAHMDALVLALVDQGVTSTRQMEFQLELNSSSLRWLLKDMVSRGALTRTAKGPLHSRRLQTYARPG